MNDEEKDLFVVSQLKSHEESHAGHTAYSLTHFQYATKHGRTPSPSDREH